MMKLKSLYNMRKINIFLWILTLFCYASCSDLCFLEDHDVFTCQLNLSGDYGIASKSSLSDGNPYLCGVNVYYDMNKDGIPSDCYARGLYDDISQAKIDLMRGYHYRFQVILYIVGDDEDLYHDLIRTFASTVDNEFQYGNGVFQNIEKSIYNKGWQTIPKVKRYYGEISDFYPHNDDVVAVTLKNVSFALRIIVYPFSEGHISLSIKNDSKSLYSATADRAGMDYFSYFSFPDAKQCWEGGQDQLQSSLSWTYESSDFESYSTTHNLELVFKRNALTTVEISYSPNSSAFIFDINEAYDNGEDISYIINDDGVLE